MQPTNKSQYLIDNANVIASNKAILRLVGYHTLRLKKEKGLSYEKLGKLVGCSDTTLYQLCNDKVNYCGISLLSRVADALGCNLLDWLQVSSK